MVLMRMIQNFNNRKFLLQPANTGKCVRIFLTVILVCQTYVAPIENGHKITRNDLSCKITYCSVGEYFC